MKTQLAIISLLTGASQLAAFFKLWFTARIFGVGSELDGYNLALVLPTLISGVMAGILQTGLFPVRARLHARGSAETVAAFERSVLWGSLAVGAMVAAVLALATPLLVPMLAESAPASVQASLRFAFPFSAALVALNMLGDCTGYLLAMRNRFVIAAGAPMINGILGGLLLAAWPQGGLLNLVIGTVLGLAAQAGICLLGLRSTGFRLVGPLPVWAQMRERGREMLALGGWILPGVVFSNLVVSLPPLWAASFGEGAVSAFGYAYRLHTSALHLLVMASSTVILARFAELVARDEVVAVQAILRKAAMASMVLGGLGVVMVWTLGGPILEWLFGGRFDDAAASRVTNHWLWMTIGLAFALLSNVHSKFWQAQSKPALMSAVALASLMALALGFILLKPIVGEFSASGALSISSIITLAIGLSVTRYSLSLSPDKPSTSKAADNR